MSGGTVQQKREEELALIKRVAKGTRKAVITGPAAARWLGLATLDWVEQVDLLLPGASKAWGSKRGYADRVYRSASISESEILVHKGIRVAVGIRALFDSYRYYGRQEALVQIEAARWGRPELTEEELLKHSRVLPRAKGLSGFRDLIRYSCATSQSPLETLVRDAILQAIDNGTLIGIESVEYQVPFTITDQFGEHSQAIVDALINGFIVIEADGAVKASGEYGDADSVTRSERHRERELQNRGLVVLRVTWQDVTSGAFIQKLKRLLEVYPMPAARPA